ncbi:hypothetical protein BGZ50_007445 [Haplosporangium sp. Z 11]|nr:hypothetical protein BGZ50_007445 [Haplosporangium sp. Z 11]
MTSKVKSQQQQQEEECVHTAIKAILDAVPNGPDELFVVLESEFPAKSDSVHAHISYVGGILRVLDYASILHTKVIGIVVTRIMEMDSLCSLETEHLELLDSKMAYDAIFKEYIMPDNTRIHVHVNNPNPPNPSKDIELGEIAYPDFEVVASTLDGMLYQVFMYIDRFVSVFSGSMSPSSPTCSPTPSLADDPSKPIQELYAVFLLNFTESILRTPTSRHAQYLVFYFTSLSPMFKDYFLGTLINRIVHAPEPQDQDAQVPSAVAATAIETGVAAAAYLSSFLNRANFRDQEYVRMTVEMLSSYALNIVERVENTAAAVANIPVVSSHRLVLRSHMRLKARLAALLDTERNTLFYAVAQALLQIFCNHWRILQTRQDEGSVRKWHLGVEDIPKIIESRLRPLQSSSTLCSDLFSSHACV